MLNSSQKEYIIDVIKSYTDPRIYWTGRKDVE